MTARAPFAAEDGHRDPLIVFSHDELLPMRTREQQRAHNAIYGEGGFPSWERTIGNAAPEHQAGILRNALVELYALAKRAAVDHVEVTDWATRIGDLCIGDADELRKIIADAKKVAETSGAAPFVPARLCPLDLKHFLQLAIKHRGMVLDPILPEKGLAMLYAARGTGKNSCGTWNCFRGCYGHQVFEMECLCEAPCVAD